jgi:DNA-binding response OmpR family regulator
MKVLFVSGHDRASLAGHGIPAAADFLQKPFSPAVLVTEVQRLLGPACPGA